MAATISSSTERRDSVANTSAFAMEAAFRGRNSQQSSSHPRSPRYARPSSSSSSSANPAPPPMGGGPSLRRTSRIDQQQQQASSSSSSPASSKKHDDESEAKRVSEWRYPSNKRSTPPHGVIAEESKEEGEGEMEAQADEDSTAPVTGIKRRRGQRSPSKTRSEGHEARDEDHDELAGDEEHGADNVDGRPTSPSPSGARSSPPPRKTPRLAQDGPHFGDSPQQTQQQSRPEHRYQHDGASSSRIRTSHSRTPSMEDGDTGAPRRSRSRGSDGEPRRPDQGPPGTVNDDGEPNYTWRSEKGAEAMDIDRSHGSLRPPASGPLGPPSRHLEPLVRLPSMTSVGPPGYHHGQQRYPGERPGGPQQTRMPPGYGGDPSPRLPSFATLQGGGGNGGGQERQHGPSSPTMPPQQAPLMHHQQQQQHGAMTVMPGSARAQGLPPYASTTGLPSYAVRSPRQPGASPSLSQHSQATTTTPSQPMIHPSLAGLPGAGGSAGGSKQQPSFVSKLYSMLEDDSIEDMIAWGPSGTVFSVANPAEFSRIVLPNWFKHSNWQSFVRQLNMYGFHKVNHTYQGTPDDEIQVWEFKHPSFRRGEIHLLNDIKRKSSRHKRSESTSRSMGGGPGYDFESGQMRSTGSATPSPEIPLATMGGGAIKQERGFASSRSAFGGASGFRDYPVAGHPGGHSRNPSGNSAMGIVGPGGHIGPGGPYGSGGGPGTYEDAGGMREGLGAAGPGPGPGPIRGPIPGETPDARIDDLSDRIDAIIRHASYLEAQLRGVSEQLYQSQQSEAGLNRHIAHLEGQLFALQDHVYAQPPPPSTSPQKQQAMHSLSSPSASHSSSRLPLPSYGSRQSVPPPPSSASIPPPQPSQQPPQQQSLSGSGPSPRQSHLHVSSSRGAPPPSGYGEQAGSRPFPSSSSSRGPPPPPSTTRYHH